MNDNLADQLRTLSELRQQGHLSEPEFESAKAKLLAAEAGAVDYETVTSLIVLQNELSNLDHQWTMDIERYKVAGRFGRILPEPGSGTTTGVVTGIFGVVFVFSSAYVANMAGSQDGASALLFLPLLGLLITVIGIVKGCEMEQKVDDYKKAEEKYQLQRAEIQAKIQAAK